jgi:hypothetical protein
MPYLTPYILVLLGVASASTGQVEVPTIVMSVATRDEASLTERIPSVIEEWLAAGRRNGRTTRE